MSPREKNLLLFFAAAGFLMLNFLAIGFFKSKLGAVDRKYAAAIEKLAATEASRDSHAQVTDQMEWLAKHEPEAVANQDVQTKLQQLCETEAKTSGLSITAQKPLAADTAGRYFHRAKFEMTVTGSDESLYRWLDRLNIPEQLRIASSIRVSPNTKDDTQIDCKAIIEQWFVPVPP